MARDKHESQERTTHWTDPADLFAAILQSTLARFQVAKHNLNSSQVEATHFLWSRSTLLDQVAIQLSQQLIKVHGLELDQKLTSETILIHIKSLVKEIFEKNSIWQETSKEIWSNLISRAIRDMQRDLGESVLESLDLAGFNEMLSLYLFDQQSTIVIDRITHLEAFYAQIIATKIIQDLDLTNQPLPALSKLLGLKLNDTDRLNSARWNKGSQRRQIVETPTELSLNNSISVAQLRESLWQSDARSIAYARYHAKHNYDNYLEHYIISSGDTEALPWAVAEQIINRYGFHTIKLHFLLAAHAMRQANPWESAFMLKASDVIGELGWDKNDSFDLPTQLNQVASTAYALSCLLVKVAWIEAQGEGQTDTSTLVGRVWEVLIHSHGQLDWRAGKIEKPEDVYITVRPGLGTIYFLNEANSQARKTLYQLGCLAGNLLQLDPYDNELALRLMIHLMLDARTRASDPNPYEYQVESILIAVLPEDVMHIQESSNNARSLFDRWNHALKLLRHLGWYPEKKTFQPDADPDQATVFYIKPYPKWLEPESTLRKPRGWVDCWLEQRLTIKPPVPETERVAALIYSSQSQQMLQPLSPSNLTGAEVRAARQASKLTQTELASLLQVHQSLIARIESGERTINPILEASLRQILKFAENIGDYA